MSGFLLAPTLTPHWAELLSFTANTQAYPCTWGLWQCGLVRFDAATLWAPATDLVSGTQVCIIGRLVFDSAVWAQAATLPYTGGAASKLVLHRWLTQPDTLGLWLNGPACVLLYSPATEQIHLWTDRMGVYPVYTSTTQPLHLGSHPDVLATQLKTSALDWVTLAEALGTGTSTQPYTYYQTIHQLEPATHYTYSAADLTTTGVQTTYWQPTQPDWRGNADIWAEQLAAALRHCGKRRGHEPQTTVGLLLSGGADSRALLYAAAQPATVQTLTFGDGENAEIAVARQIAHAVSAPHRVLLRDFEHYGQGAWETVRITGGHWSIKDAHYHGFQRELQALNCDSLMTGCYTDYLYKGLGYNCRPWTLAGKTLPLERLADFAPDFYQPHRRIAPHWQAQIAARSLTRIPEALRTHYRQNPAPIEDLRIRPLAREADAMGRLYLLRTLNWDPVMVDNELLEFYGALPPPFKLNAQVFRKAVARLSPPQARRIRNNNDDAPLHAEMGQRLAYALSAKLRRRLTGQHRQTQLATRGSWPNFAYYIQHSPVIAELWANPSASQRALCNELLGFDPWTRSLEHWAKQDLDLYLRLLTMKIWLTQRGY